MTRRSRNAGFSLLELLIVVVLICIGYWVLYGPGSNYVLNRNRAVCLRNLERLHGVLTVYATDHDGAYPDVPGALTTEPILAELVPAYTTETDLFFCPGRGGSAAGDLRVSRMGYAYYAGRRRTDPGGLPLASDRQVDVRSKQIGATLFSGDGNGPANNHRKLGGHILLCEGSVVFDSPQATREYSFVPPVRLLNPRD